MTGEPQANLPNSWELADLCEVAELNPRLDKSAHTGNPMVSFVPMLGVEAGTGVIDVSQTRSLEEVKKGYTPFREGDVLFAKITPCMENGKMAVVPPLKNDLGFGSTEFHVLRPYCEISAQYVYFFVSSESFRRDAGHNMTGAVGQRRVPTPYLADQSIPVPSAREQRRIVAKIEELFSELDKGVESLKTAWAQLKVYRQAVLKHAFEGKLTAQWREGNKDKLEMPEQLLARIKQERAARYDRQLKEWETAVKAWEEGSKSGKKPVRPRMPKSVLTMAEEEITHLESLPSGWLWLTAESVGIVQLGRQRSPKNRSKDYPTKYIRAANITEQGLDLDDILDMDFLPHELSAYRLGKGDLVLSEASGSAAQVGKPAIWNDQIQNCCFQNTVIRHQPHCRAYAVYLLWLYRFFYVSGKFAQVAGGVGINHLSAFKFAQIALPLCSLAEQQEIVRLLEERFAAIEWQEREIDSALKQAETLRQAILKKAFSGQLVAQDPHDEPASVLLDRIKAAREQAVKNNHAKKTKKKKMAA